MLSFEPQGRGGLTTLEKGLSYWRINGKKINPMQVWLSSLSPCCLKPGDRGRLGPEVLADRRSRLLAF